MRYLEAGTPPKGPACSPALYHCRTRILSVEKYKSTNVFAMIPLLTLAYL